MARLSGEELSAGSWFPYPTDSFWERAVEAGVGSFVYGNLDVDQPPLKMDDVMVVEEWDAEFEVIAKEVHPGGGWKFMVRRVDTDRT